MRNPDAKGVSRKVRKERKEKQDGTVVPRLRQARWPGTVFLSAMLLLLMVVPSLARHLEPFKSLPVPVQNPQTPEKVELGRKLFFDRRLSGDGTMSCSSCHDPE